MKSYKRIFTEVDNTKSKNVAIRVYRKTFEDYYNKVLNNEGMFIYLKYMSPVYITDKLLKKWEKAGKPFLKLPKDEKELGFWMGSGQKYVYLSEMYYLKIK